LTRARRSFDDSTGPGCIAGRRCRASEGRPMSLALTRWVIVVAALAAVTPPARAGGEPGRLFPVHRNGKWGYIDRSGRVVIELRFDRAERFSEGLAPVVLDGKHGYVDLAGRMALVPEQQPDGPVHRRFADGLAAVRVGDAIGFIDRSGKLVIPARFKSAQDFSEGVTFACDWVACGYIDRSGSPVVSAGLSSGMPFRNGIAGMSIRGDGRHAERFVLHDAKRGRLPGDYDNVGSFSEGLIAVRHQGRWGYVDRAGRGVIGPRFSGAGEFSEGLAPVYEQAWTCGYADRTGKLVIPARFRLCHPFSGGRARVEILGPDPKIPLPGFIDNRGAAVIEGAAATPPFTSAKDFADGLAAVEAPGPAGGTRLGYIDPSGRYVWPPTE
jgi:WG containing repeat